MNYRIIGIAIIFSYIFIKIGLDSWWRIINQYYGYGFELLFVLVVGFLYREKLKLKFNFTLELLVGFIPALISGFLIFLLIIKSGLTIPFNFNSLELVIALLLIAPILEESIFRMALWEPIQELFNNKQLTLISSAMLFSIGHLIAFWAVPINYKPFVLIQTLYVILLGVSAGYRRIQSGSVVPAIIVHFGFNLGFYLASLYFI